MFTLFVVFFFFTFSCCWRFFYCTFYYLSPFTLIDATSQSIGRRRRACSLFLSICIPKGGGNLLIPGNVLFFLFYICIPCVSFFILCVISPSVDEC
ncbi:uncharacterized protein GGS25DRAFT_490962, partial [Hypoxylon fragiforme]|uniref:uncharacterized protein n=1 Tax=Hypoxylon fragiforme TaxID=63214 RepID=UPI0020C6A045